MDQIERRRAIEGARQDVNALIVSGFLNHGEEWIKAWYSYGLRWSESDGGYLTIPKKNIPEFVEHALRCPKVFRLFMFFSGTRLASNVPIPCAIRTIVAEHLTGGLQAPCGKQGRSTTWGRDFIIINTMRRLLDSYEMVASANRDQRGIRDRKVNASVIMKEALEETEIGHMTTEQIQKIWGSRAKQANHNDAFSLYLASIFDDEPELERV